MSSFGAGLGTVIGSSMGASDLSSGLSAVNGIGSNLQAQEAPNVNFGQSFLQPATSAITNLNNTAGNVQSYDDFMKNYTNTPGVQYQLGQANNVASTSAAANGQALSGANIRNNTTIDQGIISTGANNAYNEYLSGNQQQFGQLNTALGDMFNAIGVGTTATGQEAGLDASQMGATSQIAQAQAKNDQSKGTGIGSMFSGLGSMLPGIGTAAVGF